MKCFLLTSDSVLFLSICLGQNITLKSLSVRELVPDTELYMTYDGSMTVPGCHETVTWIIINKPLFITRQQV